MGAVHQHGYAAWFELPAHNFSRRDVYDVGLDVRIVQTARALRSMLMVDVHAFFVPRVGARLFVERTFYSRPETTTMTPIYIVWHIPQRAPAVSRVASDMRVQYAASASRVARTARYQQSPAPSVSRGLLHIQRASAHQLEGFSSARRLSV